MTELTADPSNASTLQSPGSGRARRKGANDRLMLLSLLALLLTAWNICQHFAFESGDTIGYWLGAGGGIMFVLLFSYPLRKHWRVLASLGRLKHWLTLHVLLGIFGPLLILVHSRFSVGSANAAVALGCMLVVAASGLVGRFLHVRVNLGLHGERSDLAALEREAGFAEQRVRSQLFFVPEFEEAMRAHGRHFAPETIDRPMHVWRLFTLATRTRALRRSGEAQLRTSLASIGRERGWSEAKMLARFERSIKLIERYLGSVAQVARLAAYARLFALWHVAHVPFVYLFVLSAVFHVFAVHAY
ncbi:MAG: hypothetical protein R3E83_16470 [Burkholderiaceae bacterium]